MHLPVFVTGDVPLTRPGAPGYWEGCIANRTSSAHCLELSPVPKQRHCDIHRNIQGEPALVFVNLVLRPTGQNLFFAPSRNVSEGLAMDEVREGFLFRPFTRDQV